MTFWRQFLGLSPSASSASGGSTEDVFTCRLPSVFSDSALYFTARFTVSVWHEAGGAAEHHALLSSARQTVRAIAAAATAPCSPADPGGARLEVDEALLHATELASHRIRWARCEQLDVPEEDVRRARERELLGHEKELLRGRHTLTVEQSRLLGEDVFTSRGQARLWWLSRFPERIDHMPRIGEALDEVVATVTNPSSHSEETIARVVELCGELVRDLLPEARDMLGRRMVAELRRVFSSHERDDLVERLDQAIGGK